LIRVPTDSIAKEQDKSVMGKKRDAQSHGKGMDQWEKMYE
jgi:hypothetical protein